MCTRVNNVYWCWQCAHVRAVLTACGHVGIVHWCWRHAVWVVSVRRVRYGYGHGNVHGLVPASESLFWFR